MASPAITVDQDSPRSFERPIDVKAAVGELLRPLCELCLEGNRIDRGRDGNCSPPHRSYRRSYRVRLLPMLVTRESAPRACCVVVQFNAPVIHKRHKRSPALQSIMDGICQFRLRDTSEIFAFSHCCRASSNGLDLAILPAEFFSSHPAIVSAFFSLLHKVPATRSSCAEAQRAPPRDGF
jgi:hypothetical protein